MNLLGIENELFIILMTNIGIIASMLLILYILGFLWNTAEKFFEYLNDYNDKEVIN